ERIPDPNAENTFRSSCLDWAALEREPGRARHRLVQKLLAIRHAEIVPRLRNIAGAAGRAELGARDVVAVRWRLGDGSRLHLTANLGDTAVSRAATMPGRVLYESDPGLAQAAELPPWSVAVALDDSR
ncbi:MAG: DUF3459 domain-containing protein, partial [Bacteroidota bacterium]|nr:DUF3459 domain-containing protein [Kiloniellaceae bacterium]